MSQKTKVIKI